MSTSDASGFESTKVRVALDKYCEVLYCLVVAKLRDIIAGLSQQVDRDSDDLNQINREKAELRKAYLRYNDLLEITRPKEERLEIALGLLLNIPVRKLGPGMSEDEVQYVPIPVDAEKVMDISKFALWKVIREIVRQTSEIRVTELQDALSGFGIKTSRQAVESAIYTHKDELRVRMQGREKYVYLNSERSADAPATKAKRKH